MTEDRHERVRKLFLAACELEPREQTVFLELVCGDDSSLRSQLEALLKEDPGSTHAAFETVRTGRGHALSPCRAPHR